ncbi:portal protein [Gordonia phage Clown]|uniref:Portal protein n=1 Tax=Gordonia phage Clown TaxID=2759393 RepID=A0A7L7SPX4_9CAUD|nr:portal protein [Gordonia phage Clown]QOC56014.1 portal protein [Gordonia phage Clown]
MKRIPDSTALAIADNANRRPTLFRNIRAGGPITAHIPVDRDRNGRPGARGDAITASAQVLTAKKIDRKVKRTPPQRWQAEAWQLRKETPELRFMGDRQARAVSQVRLYIGRRDQLDEEPTPVTDGPAAELAMMLFGNGPMVEQSMKRYAQHLIFNGESLILLTTRDGNHIEWAPHAPAEITGDSPNFKLNDGITTTTIDPNTQILVRSWTPDPERSALPDAPVVAILPVARELIGLTKYVSAQVDSRLAGAGLLLLPQGIESMMGGQADDDDYSFADELTDYMVVPIRDRDSAASVVPFMAMVPPELVDKVKHITFDSPLDPHMHERRQEAIRRIALGMDSDPSVLLGMASANHWSAWSVDENEVKLGVAPIASTACHALTQVVQPILEQMGVQDADQHMVWFDTGALDLRPDRSKDAQAIYDKSELSAEALRRENGFTEDDAPNKDEAERALLIDLLKGAPSLAPLLLPKLGIEIEQPVLEEAKKITKATDANTADEPAADTGDSPVAPSDDRGTPDTRTDPPPAAEGL